MHFRFFSLLQGFFFFWGGGGAKISNVFEVLEIPDIFFLSGGER